MRVQNLVSCGSHVVAIGKYSGSSDFGFRAFLSDNGKISLEIHHAHPLSSSLSSSSSLSATLGSSSFDESQTPTSSSFISSSVFFSGLLYTFSSDGVKSWDVSSFSQNSKIDSRSNPLLNYPPQLSCVSHNVVTQKNEIWCASPDSLHIWRYLPLEGVFPESVDLEPFFPVDSITKCRISAMFYSVDLDVIWISVSHFLLRFHVIEKTGIVHNLRGHVPKTIDSGGSDEKKSHEEGKGKNEEGEKKNDHGEVSTVGEGDDSFSSIQTLFYLPNCRLLWIIPATFHPFFRTILSDDMSQDLPSLRNVPLPPDVGRVTTVMSTNRMTIFSGHWDGTIVEWIHQDVTLLPRHRILRPHKHVSRPISSIVMVWDTTLWSADSDGVVCVWK